MPQTYRVLGQSSPLATTLTDAYTVLKPVRSAVISSINACNRSATPTTIRIAISVRGGVVANKDYIAYDMPIQANDTLSFNLGISLAQDDIIRVYNTLATVSFNIFGLENA